ncbi:MAG: hypothetical protein KGJ12_08525 [Gammaproteobacteria bacterium]|nr:hypothetical protein [Gammaproteobacteria bacterium]
MKTEAWGLLRNLRGGARIAFGRSVTAADFRINTDQVFLLFLTSLAVRLVIEYLWALPHPQFTYYAFGGYFVHCAVDIFAAYLVVRLLANAVRIIDVLVLVLAADQIVTLIGIGLWYPVWRELPSHRYLVDWTFFALPLLWLLVALSLAFHRVFTAGRLRTTLLIALYLVVVAGPSLVFSRLHFWYPQTTYPGSERYAGLNQEEIYYRQLPLLGRVTAHLQSHRKGRINFYFLGIAGDGGQDVFMKEALYAQHLFDSRFGTRGRSLVLINNPRTVSSAPIASDSNLRLALKAIGRRMDRDRDILFLFLTSHGAPGLFENDLYPLDLNDLTPQELNSALNAAGIRWRVIVISACYSGSFLNALKNNHTLIATAAAPDRTSFGCSNEADFTYFGRAVFKDQLQKTHDILTALQRADAEIAQRETREKLPHSDPEIFVGKDIGIRLKLWRQEWLAQPTNSH